MKRRIGDRSSVGSRPTRFDNAIALGAVRDLIIEYDF